MKFSLFSFIHETYSYTLDFTSYRNFEFNGPAYLHFPEEHMHVSLQTYRSKYHVQGHGDVKIQGVVVHHADSEEHGHHYGVVPERQRQQFIIT